MMLVVVALVSQPMTMPHTVYTRFVNESGEMVPEENLYWEAWRANYPNDVLSIENSISSKYLVPEGQNEVFVQVQTADFVNALEDGDVVTVYLLELSTGAHAQVDIQTEQKNSFELYPDLIRLSTYDAPPAPILEEVNVTIIENGAKASLVWEPVDRVDGYRVYIGLDEQYLKEIADIQECKIKVNVESGKDYYWSVEPYNEFGTAIVSRTFKFSAVEK